TGITDSGMRQVTVSVTYTPGFSVNSTAVTSKTITATIIIANGEWDDEDETPQHSPDAAGIQPRRAAGGHRHDRLRSRRRLRGAAAGPERLPVRLRQGRGPAERARGGGSHSPRSAHRRHHHGSERDEHHLRLH